MQVAILILSLKRTYILFIALFLLAFVFTLIYQKRTRVKGVFIASVLGAIGIYYGALVISVQEERGKDLTQESIEKEGRY